MIAKAFVNSVLNFIFHNECGVCKSISSTAVCNACMGKMHVFEGERCSVCSRPIKNHAAQVCISCQKDCPLYAKSVSYCEYDETSSRITKNFKYHGNMQMGKFMLKNMIISANLLFEIGNIDIIVPVPMHSRRMIVRTYNQAAILTRGIAKAFKMKVNFRILKRVKGTEMQSIKNRSARFENIKNAFTINKNVDISGKTILLVDDVITTGATVTECTKLLLAAGAKNVYCVSFAKSLGDEIIKDLS